MNETQEPRFVKAEIVNHPSGKFMWSAALGGVLIAWLVHHGELQKTERHFFWPMVGVNFLLQLASMIIAYIGICLGSLGNLVLSVAWYVASSYLLGLYGASRIKLCLPNYTEQDYKRREKIGIVIGVVGVVLWIAIQVLMGSAGSMVDAGVNDLEVL